MKTYGMGPRRGRRIAIAWKTFAVALAIGLAGPAIGELVAPPPAEAQVEGALKVKRFLLWDICSRIPCMRGYCCGWSV